MTIAAAAVLALVGGLLNDRLGRRPVIMVASLIFTVGSLIMGFAKDKYVLLVGRVVVGAGIGECMAVCVAVLFLLLVLLLLLLRFYLYTMSSLFFALTLACDFPP